MGIYVHGLSVGIGHSVHGLIVVRFGVPGDLRVGGEGSRRPDLYTRLCVFSTRVHVWRELHELYVFRRVEAVVPVAPFDVGGEGCFAGVKWGELYTRTCVYVCTRGPMWENST